MILRRLATAAVLAVMTTLPLHAAETKVGRVGDFDILAISEKGKFNRCAASSKNGSGMLRLAFTAGREYSLSIPGIKGKGPGPMSVTFDGGFVFDLDGTGANDGRAWVFLDLGVVEAFLSATESLDVTFGGRRYTWALYNQPMEDMFEALENCVISRAP